MTWSLTEIYDPTCCHLEILRGFFVKKSRPEEYLNTKEKKRKQYQADMILIS